MARKQDERDTGKMEPPRRRMEADEAYAREHPAGYLLTHVARRARGLPPNPQPGRAFWGIPGEILASGALNDGVPRPLERRFRPYERGEPDQPQAYRWPKGFTRSAQRVREDVCDALGSAPELDARDMEVEVRSGEVHLAGHVTERWMRYRAEQICAAIPGVKEVHNDLVVRPAESD